MDGTNSENNNSLDTTMTSFEDKVLQYRENDCNRCTTLIYKFNDQNRREQVGKIFDDIPDSHEVGLKYGPGRYEVKYRYYILNKDATKKDIEVKGTHGFSIADCEAYRKKETALTPANNSNGNEILTQVQAMISAQSNQFATALKSLAESQAKSEERNFEFMKMLVLEKSTKSGSNTMMDDMVNTFSKMGTNMMNMQTKFVTDVAKNQLENVMNGNNNISEPVSNPLWDFIEPFKEKIIDIVLNPNPINNTVAKGMLNQPNVQNLLSNQQDVEDTLGNIASEFGSETAEKLREMLKQA